MWTLYDSILSLCTERGIKGGKMCVELGLSKSLMTDLKTGRKKGITADTAQKIADYFGVTVDRVLNGPETEKAPTPQGERLISDEDLKFALWGDAADIDDADLEDVRRYAAFVRERKKNK